MKREPTAILSFGVLHGGMEMDAFRIAKLLAKNTKVTMIVKKDAYLDTNYRDLAAEKGIDIEAVKFHMYFSPSLIFSVRKIIKERKIKNVLFFGASEMRSLYFSFLGLDTNLIIRHGMKKTRPKKDLLHRLVYSDVNWHVSICQYLIDNVREIIPFGRHAKEKLIYSSLRYLPENLPEPSIRKMKPLRLLHVARIAPGKGQVDAIKTCSVLYEMNIPFELTCIGEIFPPFEERFNSVLQSVPYKDSIKLPGFCNNVPDYLRNADIFFYPSSGEGLSNSFIEALSYGLVCIAYKNTSFPELRELGFEYFIAEHEDLKDLKNKLIDAVDYIKKNKVPIQKNVELAKNLFSSDRELEEFLEILE
jgi:glycosyltransferase involved in cell wall biosynthesis